MRPLVPRPLDLVGHTAAERPGWTATYELLRPYPTSASGGIPQERAAGALTLPVCRRSFLAFFRKFVVLVQIRVYALAMVDDPQDLDEAEGGAQPPQRRLLLGVEFGHGRSGLPLR